MIPILPRVMLWTDKYSMDEFFRLDPINEAFFEVFITLREEPFAVQTEEVKVFNEVYYQVTRMVFEHPLPSNLSQYIADIKANIGWNYSAELVMSMAYYLVSLIDNNERPLNKFFTKAINEKFFECIYWKPFKHCFERLKKEKRHVKYSFIPCPIETEWLKDKYVHWNTITKDYDILCIEKVVNLWRSVEEKREVARMIVDSIGYTTTHKNATDLAHIRHFMAVHFISDKSTAIWKDEESSSWVENDILRERIDKITKEKQALLARIAELEAEREKQDALLETKRNGTARKFTLIEIVNYCKSRVDWDDVKSIVAMLNKLLRRIATEADEKLVDSIENEFKNRKYGDTVMGDKNEFKANSGLNKIALPPGMTPQEAIKLLQHKGN